jgi:hypothetical protein
MADLTRTVESFTSDLQTEVETQVLGTYGVGIDTHKQFIQVCVLVRNGETVDRFEREFSTDWTSLCNARDWILSKINTLCRVLGCRGHSMQVAC